MDRARLRSRYDLELPPLETDPGSRGAIYRAIPDGSWVLDVGCDTGRFGAALRKEKSCRVDGIEMDSAAAATAEHRLDRVFQREIVDERSFAGLSGYDVVLFLDVLEHLVDPWIALQGARKVLRPQGRVYVVTPNIAHVSVVRRLLKGEFEYQEHGTMDRTHLRWFTRKSLGRSLLDGGFVGVRVETIRLVPWLDESRFTAPLGRLLATLFPNLLAGSLIGIGQSPGSDISCAAP